jgi:hypothetical protein
MLNDVIDTLERYIDDFPVSARSAGLLSGDDDNEEAAARAAEVKLDFVVGLADANLLSAVLMVQQDKRLKGAWRMRKAWATYSTLLHRKQGPPAGPLGHCVRFGAGLFMYMLSMMPTVIARVLEVVGFESNRPLGLRLLSEAAAEPGVHQARCNLILLMNLLVVPRALADVNAIIAQARPIIERCLAVWPSSPFFRWMASFERRKVGDSEGALAHVEAAIAAATSDGSKVPGMLESDRAACLLMLLRWNEAAQAFDRMSEDPGSSFRGMAKLVSAACRQKLGDSEAAIKILSNMPPEKELLGKDRLSVEIAKHCVGDPASLVLLPF